MAIGDSISQGAEIHYANGGYGVFESYRERLWETIVRTYGTTDVDMVGPFDYAWENDENHIYSDPLNPDRNTHDDDARHVPHPVGGDPDAIGTVYSQFDPDHYAMAGWTGEFVLAQLPSLEISPDIAIIYLGVNDVRLGQSGDAAAAEIGEVIRGLQASNSDIKILVGLLSPLNIVTDELNREIGEFNTVLANLAASQSTPASPVVVVDHWTPYVTGDNGTPSDYGDDFVNRFALGLTTLDGLHPNTIAQSIMADRWWPALNGFISDVQSSGAQANAASRLGATGFFGELIQADFNVDETVSNVVNPFTFGSNFAGHLGAEHVIGSSSSVRAFAVPEPNFLLMPWLFLLGVGSFMRPTRNRGIGRCRSRDSVVANL